MSGDISEGSGLVAFCLYKNTAVSVAVANLCKVREGHIAMAESSIVIRHATLDDKNDVLNINRNVEDGLDYLPFRYEKFLTCKNTKCYVAVRQEKLVSRTFCFKKNNIFFE